jgi:hypothetical protein
VDLSGNLLVLLHANPFRDSNIYRYQQLFTFLPTDFICISYDIQNRQILLSCAALTIWSFEWGLFCEVLFEIRNYSLHWVASITILFAYERTTSLPHSDWWHRTLCSANSRDKNTVCRLREIVRSGICACRSRNFCEKYVSPLSKRVFGKDEII